MESEESILGTKDKAMQSTWCNFFKFQSPTLDLNKSQLRATFSDIPSSSLSFSLLPSPSPLPLIPTLSPFSTVTPLTTIHHFHFSGPIFTLITSTEQSPTA